MKKLIILTDNNNNFLISKADLKNYTSMDIEKIKECFEGNYFKVDIKHFGELDLNSDYNGQFILYQSSESFGAFYKRYIEDLIFFLEKKGAITLPKYEYLKAHHNKVFMEMMRINFSDVSLKTITSRCFGSISEALHVTPTFPVVIKQASGSASEGVFLANNSKEYKKYLKKAGNVIVSQNIGHLSINYAKNSFKRLMKYFNPQYKNYINFNTTPVNTPIIVQPFINGLKGDYKVLVFGNKYYTLYRKNRANDFRASGSGLLYEVKEEENIGLLDFARKITFQLDFPVLGFDIGFDGAKYHLIEFQMIHLGPYTLQVSDYWHENIEGEWIKFNGKSNLEEEFSRSIMEYINSTY